MTWSEEDIAAASTAARDTYHTVAAYNTEAIAWRGAAKAALSAVFVDHEDYFDEHEDVRAALLEPAPVDYVDVKRIRCGTGPDACEARYDENPNWVLAHAANALALYRVLAGHDPRPEDPASVERERMAKVLEAVDPGASTAMMAQQLQELGFTLPRRAA